MKDTDLARLPTTGTLRLGYTRRLFFVATLAVMLLIVASAVAVSDMLISYQHQEFAQRFAAHREAVKEEVDRHQVSLAQLVETSRLSHLYLGGDVARTRALQVELARGEVWVPVHEEGPSASFSLFTTLTGSGDAKRLSGLLELVRYASTFPLAREDQSLAVSQGFVYTPDLKFLASLPPGGDVPAREPLKPNPSVEATIGARVEMVENAVREAERDGRGNEVTWVTASQDPLTKLLTTYYASSIYEGGKRVATVVSWIPCTRFNQFFLHDDGDPHFFVIACRLQRLLGLDDTQEQERHWASIVSRMPWMYAEARDRPQRVFQSGSFFLYQRVPGPQWVAVYAYRWTDLLSEIKEQLLLVLGLTVLGCSLVGGGAYWTRRSIIQPADDHLRSLLESEAFSRSAIQVAPVSLLVVDRESGDVLLQNAEAGALQQRLKANSEDGTEVDLGYQASELTRQHIAAALGPGMVQRFEMNPDIEVAYVQAKYHGRDVFVLGMVDLAQRKEIERRLRASRARAEAESREKGMFLATMSHEIRTPLHGALGNLELLSTMGLSAEQRARLTVAQDAFSALLSLINDVLDLSKSEVGELALREIPVHVDRIVEQAVRTFSAEAQLAGIRLLCLIAPNSRGRWYCDSTRLTQVVMNLLGNAVKFTERGSITVTVSMREEGKLVLSVADSGRGIAEEDLEQIFVPFVQGRNGSRTSRAGSGLGLALCHAIVTRMGGEIFVESELGAGSIFTVTLPLRGASSSDDVVSVHGVAPAFLIRCPNPLWLPYLSEQLVHWYPGAYVVDLERAATPSVPANFDTTVLVDACERVDQMVKSSGADVSHLVISLDGPMVALRQNGAMTITAYSGELLLSTIEALLCGQTPESASVLPPVRLPTEVKHARILVVEDDRISAQLLEDQLLALGVRDPEIVETAEAAEDLCNTRTFDLVITDSNLPGKSGADFADVLRGLASQARIVLCTADVTVDNDVRSLFDDVIFKPSSLADIRNALAPLFAVRIVRDATRSGREHLEAMFAESWPADKAALEAMMAEGDFTRIRARLHRVKGGLLVLGMKRAAESVERFEASEWAPEGEFAQGLQELVSEIDDLVDRLRSP